MELKHCILRPGTVREVLPNGCIRADAPGLFAYDDDTSKLPPIHPFMFGCSTNQFSSVEMYEHVWILNSEDNPEQLCWFKMQKTEQENAELFGLQNVEVLCNRESGFDRAQLYFSDGTGWIIGLGETRIILDPDNTITLTTGDDAMTLDISPSGISLGKRGESSHPAALGDEVTNTFREIYSTLTAAAAAALPNSATAAIGTALTKGLIKIADAMSKIESTHVTLE